MTRQDVLEAFESKAISQWFYRGLLDRLSEVSEETANKFFDRFADSKDVVDVLMLADEGILP